VPLAEEQATAADVQSFVGGYVRSLGRTPGPAIELEDIDWTTVDCPFVLTVIHAVLSTLDARCCHGLPLVMLTTYARSASNNAFVSLRSAVLNPSVNQW
jgi:hypothetical protein